MKLVTRFMSALLAVSTTTLVAQGQLATPNDGYEGGYHIIFLTSSNYAGNEFSGVVGAHERTRDFGNAGTATAAPSLDYTAIISGFAFNGSFFEDYHAKDIIRDTYPIYNTRGDRVADNYAALFAPPVDPFTSFNFNEDGTATGRGYWSGTNKDGTRGLDCENWSMGDIATPGIRGDADSNQSPVDSGTGDPSSLGYLGCSLSLRLAGISTGPAPGHLVVRSLNSGNWVDPTSRQIWTGSQDLFYDGHAFNEHEGHTFDVAIRGANINLNQDIDVDNLTVDINGHLSGDNKLTVLGQFQMTFGSTVAGAGETTVGSLNIGGVGFSGLRTTLDRAIDVQGDAVWKDLDIDSTFDEELGTRLGSVTVQGNSTFTATRENTGNLNVKSFQPTIELQDDSKLVIAAQRDFGKIINDGEVVLQEFSSFGTSASVDTLDNRGVVRVGMNGRLEIFRAIGNGSYNLGGNGQLRLTSGTGSTINGSINGSGEVEILSNYEAPTSPVRIQGDAYSASRTTLRDFGEPGPLVEFSTAMTAQLGETELNQGTIGGTANLQMASLDWGDGTINSTGSVSVLSGVIGEQSAFGGEGFASGNLTLDNAMMDIEGSANLTNGFLTGSGQLTVTDGGQLNRVAGDFGDGDVEVGVKVHVAIGGSFVQESTGTATFNGATFVNNGTLQVNQGTVDMSASYSGNGSIVVTPTGQLQFTGPMTHNGNITGSGELTSTGTLYLGADSKVAPGDSAGSLALNANVDSSGNFRMEIGGLVQATEHDFVDVNGSLAINGGDLVVSLIDGFTPVEGNSFDLVDFDAPSASGQFDRVLTADLPGVLAWDTSSIYTTGAITVIDAGFADFDDDGELTTLDIDSLIAAAKVAGLSGLRVDLEDGTLTVQDIDTLAAEEEADSSDSPFDLNGDGQITAGASLSGVNSDLDYLVRTILGTDYGDANLNGVPDALDLDALRDNYGQTSVGWAGGDFDGSGKVGIVDLVLLSRWFGFGSTAPLSASLGVPEPSAIWLASLAVAMISARRHRRVAD